MCIFLSPNHCQAYFDEGYLTHNSDAQRITDFHLDFLKEVKTMADKPVISDERRIELETRAEKHAAQGTFRIPHSTILGTLTSRQRAENNIYEAAFAEAKKK